MNGRISWFGVFMRLVAALAVVLMLGTLVWMLRDYGVLNPDSPSLLSWVTLIVIGIILGIGLSWSLLRARMTGQVEVD
jgi:uncharacterized membrane protein YphA (DoxX/SURF4 family)